MKSMNKYLLLTSSAIILARVSSAALEADARENKAVVNNLEFNRKFSELNPPSLVIPPFSSAKDYKRLAGICFLGIGDCGGGMKYNQGDDYTKGCDAVNPCNGFTLTSTASCTEGYTSCNTGCETKYKCNPPSYTQTCDYPYQGVGSPLNGKYRECECRSEFVYGTNDCPSPQVPDTSSDSCDGRYSRCTCPSSYSETCNSPYQGVGDSCNGKYQSCQCPSNYNLTCEGMQGVGEACNGFYAECTDLPCKERGFTQTCSGLQTGVGEACDGLYKSCTCRSDLVSCTGVQKGVGESCGGYYASCTCRSDLVSCSSVEQGVGASCGGQYLSCNCRSNLVSCTGAEVGVGEACGGKYASCECPSSYRYSCNSSLEVGVGSECGGLYEDCKCRSDLVSCSGSQVGVGSSCDGRYLSCKCPSSYNQVCGNNQSCSGSTCGGLCNGTCVTIPSFGPVMSPSSYDECNDFPSYC